MPTKDDPRITVRLDQGTYERLVEWAEQNNLSVGAYVRQQLQQQVGRTDALARTLECPVPRCDFKAYSPSAKCPVHGRTVRWLDKEQAPSA